MTPKQFISAYLIDAVKSQVKTGVPFLLTLAQAAHESGWGEYAKGNNFFGIKAGKSWNGETQILKTHEYVDGKKIYIEAKFRKYASPADSFNDHGEFIKLRFAESFKHSNPCLFAESIQNDYTYKYATDPAYAQLICKMITMLSIEILKI